jgi:predicted dehydrogenase
VTVALLQHGIHVLVEKPMALTKSECNEMISASEKSQRKLAIGLVRRFYGVAQFVTQLVKEEAIGKINSFDAREGDVYSWPVASSFMFRKEAAGGGVLVDAGAHMLDLIIWWLGDYESVKYYDDAMGGVEADCELHLTMKNGAKGFVNLSRIRNLRNSIILYGDRGTIEVEVGLNSKIKLQFEDDTLYLTGQVFRDAKEVETYEALMKRQVLDFVQAIHNNCQPYVSGDEAKRSVALIEECYRSRQFLAEPWIKATAKLTSMKVT